jgi:hypothetical protein
LQDFLAYELCFPGDVHGDGIESHDIDGAVTVGQGIHSVAPSCMATTTRRALSKVSAAVRHHRFNCVRRFTSERTEARPREERERGGVEKVLDKKVKRLKKVENG